MTKTARAHIEKIKHYVTLYPTEFEKSRYNQLWCVLCKKKVTPDRAVFINSHRKTSKHQTEPMKTRPTTITNIIKGFYFKKDIILTLLECNIPFNNLNITSFKSLFNKYNLVLPSANTK